MKMIACCVVVVVVAYLIGVKFPAPGAAVLSKVGM